LNPPLGVGSACVGLKARLQPYKRNKAGINEHISADRVFASPHVWRHAFNTSKAGAFAERGT
jgi:hypothetical protein